MEVARRVDGALFLQEWYKAQCNQDWEHEYGIRISTLDNPGWHLEVDLLETTLESSTLKKVKTELPEGRWLWSWADGEVFHATCDELSLKAAFEEFRRFVGLNQP